MISAQANGLGQAIESNILGMKDKNMGDFGYGLESLLQLLEPLSDDQNKYEEAFGIEPSR